MPKKFTPNNILKNIPLASNAEVFETLAQAKGFTVERITSRGQTTPVGQWLVQAQDEWVIVLKGQGRLRFKGRSGNVTLKPGEHVFIPAGKAHRVEWTSPRANTIWLAVFGAHTADGE